MSSVEKNPREPISKKDNRPHDTVGKELCTCPVPDGAIIARSKIACRVHYERLAAEATSELALDVHA